MNQRKVWSWRSGNVRLLALVISVALHLVMLAVFGIAKFSKCESLAQQRKRQRRPDVAAVSRTAAAKNTVKKLSSFSFSPSRTRARAAK